MLIFSLFCRHTDQPSLNKDQMTLALRSGILQIWVEKNRSAVVSLSGGRQSEFSRNNLQIITAEIIEMKKFIDKMTRR